MATPPPAHNGPDVDVEMIDSTAAAATHNARVSFADGIFANDLIYQQLFSYCTPGTIVGLSKTCRLGYAAAGDYCRRAFDINSSLSRFFDDPKVFRSLQARTGVLISGSFALQYFGRFFYPESDLDLYVPMHSRQECGRYILEQGYQYTPREDQEEEFEEAMTGWVEDNAARYSWKGIAGVFTFMRPSRDDPSRQDKVQMIVASRSPMEVILGFHSTVVMNVIGFDRAIALFPFDTFEEMRTLVTSRQTGESHKRAIEKYKSRGWKIVKKLRYRHFGSNTPQRWICDHHSWVIPLNLDGVEVPAASYCDPFLATSWTLQSSKTNRWKAQLQFDIVQYRGSLYPLVNADPLVVEMAAVILGQPKKAITGGKYWLQAAAGNLATEHTPQTQLIVESIIAFLNARRGVEQLNLS